MTPNCSTKRRAGWHSDDRPAPQEQKEEQIQDGEISTARRWKIMAVRLAGELPPVVQSKKVTTTRLHVVGCIGIPFREMLFAQ